MKIFQQIPPPERQAKLPINQYALWYTWSQDFLAVCRAWTNEARLLREPRFVHLQGGRPYDYTYSLDPSRAVDERVAQSLRPFIEDLYNLPDSKSIILFDSMLNESLGARGLRLLFTFIRDVLVSLSGDPMSALYAPLSGTQNEFPVHADLYVPQTLFNVFEDVPNDSSGASLFLSVSEFKQLLPTVNSLPESSRERIVKILNDELKEDHYEEFYALLYLNAWSKELKERVKPKLLRVKLYSGQGYLINDRVWLHGRGRVKGGVSKKRLHRLIFNTRFKQPPPIG